MANRGRRPLEKSYAVLSVAGVPTLGMRRTFRLAPTPAVVGYVRTRVTRGFVMAAKESLVPMGPVEVAVAAIVNRQGEVLVARRAEHVHQGGLWEFPGGKIEPGETVTQALAREVSEELGLAVVGARPLIRVEHRYPDKHVRLHVCQVEQWTGTPRGREGQPLQWLAADALDPAQFPAANRAIIRALQLPDCYLITPQPQGGNEAFLTALGAALARGVRLIQLRATACSPDELERLAGAALALCRGHGSRLLVNASPDFARAQGADGVHLSSARLMALSERPLGPEYWVAASCHNAQEMEHACALGVDFVVVSPVVATRSHPEARPIGWQGLAALTGISSIPVYALGGLGPADLPAARGHGALGIAAIRGLWDEGGA